jgi:hypothetical protein
MWIARGWVLFKLVAPPLQPRGIGPCPVRGVWFSAACCWREPIMSRILGHNWWPAVPGVQDPDRNKTCEGGCKLGWHLDRHVVALSRLGPKSDLLGAETGGWEAHLTQWGTHSPSYIIFFIYPILLSWQIGCKSNKPRMLVASYCFPSECRVQVIGWISVARLPELRAGFDGQLQCGTTVGNYWCVSVFIEMKTTVFGVDAELAQFKSVFIYI